MIAMWYQSFVYILSLSDQKQCVLVKNPVFTDENKTPLEALK
jgi:hypothetical protein